MAKQFRHYLTGAALLAATGTVFGQATPAQPAPAPAPPPVDYSYKPLTLKLNDNGSKYVRFLMWHQIWATSTQNNPGTIDVNGNDIGGKWTNDVAIRRSRFLAYAQINPRFLILTHWGINNQSFINGGASAGANVAGAGAGNNGKRPQLYIHDAWTEYAISPGKLHMGGGLHYWNGVSRLTSNSTLNFMTMDAPIFNWSTIEAADQFARQFGIYAKGQLGKLDYRFAVNKPFVNGVAASGLSAQPSGKEIAVNVWSEKTAYQGYVNYMFWDKESNLLPFFVGTYLGAKKVFNIGVGFYTQPEASGTRVAGATAPALHGQTAIGADVFLDMPLDKAKGTALNFLATYYNLDFGPRYMRNIGILNEHTTTLPVNATNPNASAFGGGNAQPTIGTGDIIYAQAGYLLPKLKNGHQVMPYATFTNKNFDRIGTASNQFGLGVNWFITGHQAKISAEYSTRPVYKADAAAASGVVRNGSAGQFTIQSHIFL